MSNPQVENGYAKIANELLEMFAHTNLSGREWQVLFVIIRKTYGYQKKQDAISYSQFYESTGIKTKNLPVVIKQLESKGLIVIDRSGYMGKYTLNKVSPKWGIPQIGGKVSPKQVVKVSPKWGNTKDIKDNKDNTVEESNDSPTPSIIFNNEIYSMEDLEYIYENPSKGKTKYGPKTMALLVRTFASAADIEIGERFDASPWSKPLSAIYNYFDKDADKAMEFILKAGKYFTEKNLSFTPHTLHRDLPLIEKWMKESTPTLNPNLYE